MRDLSGRSAFLDSLLPHFFLSLLMGAFQLFRILRLQFFRKDGVPIIPTGLPKFRIFWTPAWNLSHRFQTWDYVLTIWPYIPKVSSFTLNPFQKYSFCPKWAMAVFWPESSKKRIRFDQKPICYSLATYYIITQPLISHYALPFPFPVYFLFHFRSMNTILPC